MTPCKPPETHYGIVHFSHYSRSLALFKGDHAIELPLERWLLDLLVDDLLKVQREVRAAQLESKPTGKSRLPDSYQQARVRCVLPACELTGDRAFALNVGDEVLRFRIGRADADFLIASLLANYKTKAPLDQSLKSSGSPSLEVSAPDGMLGT